MYLAGLVVIVCIFQGVTAPPGSTKLCRNCHRLVRGPAECMEFHHCKQPCVTDVYQSNGENMFMYSCHHESECPADPGHLHGPGHIHEHNHEHGTHVCRECCHSNGCDQHTCSQFFHTTPTITTPTPAPTTTTATTTTITPAPTTTLPDPSATTKGMTITVQTAASAAIQNCTDTASNVFTCADMKYFGYCDPAAGSGYALAQKMCRVTCGFCP